MLRNGNLKVIGTLRSCVVINPSLGVKLSVMYSNELVKYAA